MEGSVEEPSGAEAPPLQAPEEHPFGAPPTNLPSYQPGPASRSTDTSGVRLEVIDLRNKKDRGRFLQMVEPIYRGDTNFIMPLWFERMRFLDPAHNRGLDGIEVRTLLAHRDGRIAGRMTAHVDRNYDSYHNCRQGWFGFFECENDQKVAHALLADGCDWLKEKGCSEVIGPNNFTTNHQCGLLVDNFRRPPIVETTYNPPYYEALLTSFGLGKAKDLYMWWIDVSQGIEAPKVARIAKVAERVRKKNGVTLRALNKSKFAAELERLFTIYNEAWQKNWGFVPLSRIAFEALIGDLEPIVREELVFFVEVAGRPVAFACTLPNINEVLPKDGRLFPFGWWSLFTGIRDLTKAKRISRCTLGRLFTLGVVPEFRKRGLETLLFVETVIRCNQAGIMCGEIGWTLEDNDLINRAIESMDGRIDRTYRLLGMKLES